METFMYGCLAFFCIAAGLCFLAMTFDIVVRGL